MNNLIWCPSCSLCRKDKTLQLMEFETETLKTVMGNRFCCRSSWGQGRLIATLLLVGNRVAICYRELWKLLFAVHGALVFLFYQTVLCLDYI